MTLCTAEEQHGADEEQQLRRPCQGRQQNSSLAKLTHSLARVAE